jgi:hypothetical protein
MNRFYRHGFGDEQPLPSPSQINAAALDQRIREREARLKFLLEHGDIFYLPVSLGLGSTPAAGTRFNSATNPLDFDVAIIGAYSTLRASTIMIKDSARSRDLTSDTTPIAAIANYTTTSVAMTRDYWQRPYLLPSKATLALQTTADGTESNGTLVFICLQPPSIQA